MGNTCSPGTQISNRIQRELINYANAEKSVLKILLLGAGETGKTTVFKQLTLTKGNGFDRDALLEYRKSLFANIIIGMLQLVQGTEDFGYPATSDPKLEPAVTLLQQQGMLDGDLSPNYQITPELQEAILKLWDSENIQKVFPRCRQQGSYDIPDTYMKMMERLQNYPTWGGKDWIPSPYDCLLIRQRSTGIAEQNFKGENMTFRLIDVGGQRSERKKWLHLFEGVTAVIFVASLAEYDQTLYEANHVNRLQESVSLFKTLAENKYFTRSVFILFFNKMDLFKQKYYHDGIPLNYSGMFPEAPTVDEEVDDKCTLALDWFRDKLIGSVDKSKRDSFYIQYTTALDTRQMELVIDLCSKHVLEMHLRAAGFITRTTAAP